MEMQSEQEYTQVYTLEELEEHIGNLIMFESRVEDSEYGEDEQRVLMILKEVRKCKNGNTVLVGVNLIRLQHEKYSLSNMPWRSFSIKNIKYGSIQDLDLDEINDTQTN